MEHIGKLSELIARMENDLKSELLKLPLSEELLQYYRHKLGNFIKYLFLEALESDLTNSIEQVDTLRVSHEESHKLSWELEKKSRQVTELQQAMSDFQVALYDERKQLLAVVAENDSFKGSAGNLIFSSGIERSK
jgi:coiled-coil domain-containing protein 77